MSAMNRWGREDLPTDESAVVLLDEAGVVQGCSRAFAQLLGCSARELYGRPIDQLLIKPTQARYGAMGSHPHGLLAEQTVFLDGPDGPVELTMDEVRLDGSPHVVLVLTPRREAEENGQSSSLLTALLAQALVGMVVYDTNLQIVRTNATAEAQGWTLSRPKERPEDVDYAEGAETIESRLRRVLETGAPLVEGEFQVRPRSGTGPERYLSLAAFRLDDSLGRPGGVAMLFTDITDQLRARRRTELGHEASSRIGTSLDVTCVAQEIADVLVPALGDMASVEIAEAVLDGEEPPKVFLPGDPPRLRRVAVASASGSWPSELVPVGGLIPPVAHVPEVREALKGQTVVNTTRQEMLDVIGDPELVRAMIPENGVSAVLCPLHARGLLLGAATLWRTEGSEPFQREDADLVFDIFSRAALSVDNARRYTREHRAAVTLQKRLLPAATTKTAAAETAGSYVPAGGGADISGDWFDAIPLPSLRVAFVVGDVFGHGLHAAATMGRLRTAIRTLADLELEPGELLIHLDDLVQQLAEEAADKDQDTMGATCLYAVYDPLTGICNMASAGHLAPAVIEPGGSACLMAVSPGPPLGVGGMPFEVTSTTLEPETTLALYTDGLVELGPGDTGQGAKQLLDNLDLLCHQDGALEDIGRALMNAAGQSPPRDDQALLLARVRRIPADNIAHWQFPDDPARVADARKVVASALATWGLDDLTFATELIVSELVTNAMRYAGGTVELRLFHDDATLVCEVMDSSNTQPRLRRARAGDEGGRGLFLVAQLARRWGSRYHRNGKTIWAEQHMGATTAPTFDLTAAWDDETG